MATSISIEEPINNSLSTTEQDAIDDGDGVADADAVAAAGNAM